MNDLKSAPSYPPSPPSPSVFIVDDEPMIGKLIDLVLQMHKCRTAVFHDPITALASFRHSDSKPDLLITDFDMPGMTGIQLICRCRTIHSQLKTILVSGSVDDALLKSLDPQPDIFIRKPFLPWNLLNDAKTLLAAG